jgi:hypothetical protein
VFETQAPLKAGRFRDTAVEPVYQRLKGGSREERFTMRVTMSVDQSCFDAMICFEAHSDRQLQPPF